MKIIRKEKPDKNKVYKGYTVKEIEERVNLIQPKRLTSNASLSPSPSIY